MLKMFSSNVHYAIFKVSHRSYLLILDKSACTTIQPILVEAVA